VTSHSCRAIGYLASEVETDTRQIDLVMNRLIAERLMEDLNRVLQAGEGEDAPRFVLVWSGKPVAGQNPNAGQEIDTDPVAVPFDRMKPVWAFRHLVDERGMHRRHDAGRHAGLVSRTRGPPRPFHFNPDRPAALISPEIQLFEGHSYRFDSRLRGFACGAGMKVLELPKCLFAGNGVAPAANDLKQIQRSIDHLQGLVEPVDNLRVHLHVQ
jgi:hypothetical protein